MSCWRRWLWAGLGVCVVASAHATDVSDAVVDEVRARLRDQAVQPPSEAALAALSGDDLTLGLMAIDPQARLIPAAEYRPPLLGSEAWTGIGASLVFQADAVLLDVYRGGPADRVGVPSRSRLLTIDGRSVKGLQPAEIAARLRGAPDTQVVLGLRSPQGASLRAHVRREAFKPLDVELVEPGDQRVLRLREFTAGLTRTAFLATIEFLQREGARAGASPGLSEGPLVIDLRDAVGGDLYEAFDLAALFLPQGAVLGEQRLRGGEVRSMPAPGGTKLTMPLVLLVGPDTASAAEVFAGALQHHQRARLVGQKTYGKCSSQTDAVLSDGSVLRFTNREILLPDGRSCSGVGLTPDVAVTDSVFEDLSKLVETARAPQPKG